MIAAEPPMGREHSGESSRFDLLLLFTASLLRKNTREHVLLLIHACTYSRHTHAVTDMYVHCSPLHRREHGGPVRASDLLKVTQQTRGRAGIRQVPWFLDQG